MSPPCWDSDVFAFKNATDVVVQGHAYAYGSRASVDAQLEVGNVARTVRVGSGASAKEAALSFCTRAAWEEHR